MLTERAFKGETETLGGSFGALITVVTFPLQTPIAQGKRCFGQHVNRLGTLGRALHGGAKHDMTDFDPAMSGDDGHQAQVAVDNACLLIDHAVEPRINVGGMTTQPRIEFASLEKRSIGQVVPQRRVRGWALKCSP